MPSVTKGFQRILVATDFSTHAEAALKQAIWVARQSGATIVLAHSVPDLRRVANLGSYGTVLDQFYFDSNQVEDFEREARRDAETKMRRMIVNLNAVDLAVSYETLVGDPFLAISQAVQQGGHDLVLAGTRGLAGWEQFLVGSTAKRLIRKCPASVWIVKAEHLGPPKAVLAATDFSDVSRRGSAGGAVGSLEQASAEFHLLHVVDSVDVPEDIISKIPKGSSLRREIDEAATHHLDEFVASLDTEPDKVHQHLSWGTPWQEVGRLAQRLKIDLLSLGTVGRSGVKGLLLGNTAEKVLATCDCSILTVKPEDYVSPIIPLPRVKQSWPRK